MKTHRGAGPVVLAGAVVFGAGGFVGRPFDDASAASATTEVSYPAGAEVSAPLDAAELRLDLRTLWTDHVVWTRLFIVSAVAGLPDTDATAARLLQNQTDIADAVAQFYGEDAGARLEALLRDHILIAGDLITAAKEGDPAAVEDRSAAWYANADEIAELLAGANPAWPVSTLQDMMRGHLDQTLREATDQLTGDYAASVADYDEITTHILQMADTLADGIITQFPDRFAA